MSICPNCAAEIETVGTWSELTEWERRRKMGRRRYVFLHGVLFSGGVSSLGTAIGFWINGGPLWLIGVVTGLCLIGGYVGARGYWSSMERKYHAARKDSAEGEAGHLS